MFLPLLGEGSPSLNESGRSGHGKQLCSANVSYPHKTICALCEHSRRTADTHSPFMLVWFEQKAYNKQGRRFILWADVFIFSLVVRNQSVLVALGKRKRK
ncbi:hypothetical protein AMECASPLE_019348 [Ameca splendens]|uniref:Uncharacterized protein n=1 Tax=Ameca splendens TaxID=208324 RepID=A0ABV0XG07_9TELE